MDSQNDSLNVVIARLDQKVTDLAAQLARQVGELKESIKSLEQNAADRITKLEQDKADRKDMDNLQSIVSEKLIVRVGSLESFKGTLVTNIALQWGAVSAILGVVVYLAFHVKLS
jgi:hypothetical protein